MRIADYHTNICRIEKNGTVLYEVPLLDETVQEDARADRSLLNMQDIWDFAETCDLGTWQTCWNADLVQHRHCRGGPAGRLRRQHRAGAPDILRQRCANRAKSQGRRRLRCAHERLRAAGRHQLRQRQPGHHLFGARSSSTPRSCARQGEALPRAGDLQPGRHPRKDRHRHPVRLLRRGQRRVRARAQASCTCAAAAIRLPSTRSSTRWPSCPASCATAPRLPAPQDRIFGGCGAAGLQHVQVQSGVQGRRWHREKDIENTIKGIGRLGNDGMRQTNEEIIRLMMS